MGWPEVERRRANDGGGEEGGRKVELVEMTLADIVPYENNPRRNDGAVDAVAESIRQCTYVAPIIVDENSVILAGHTRYKALQKLGRMSAEVVVKRGLTEEQKRKYRLLDNKTGEIAGWDFDLLADELDGLDFGDLDLGWGVCEEPTDEECNGGDLQDNTEKPVEAVFTFANISQFRKVETQIREIIDAEHIEAKVRIR